MGELIELIAVDVGDKPDVNIFLCVRQERFVGHARTEIAAANPDIDHCTNALAGVPDPFT